MCVWGGGGAGGKNRTRGRKQHAGVSQTSTRGHKVRPEPELPGKPVWSHVVSHVVGGWSLGCVPTAHAHLQ